MNVKSPLLVAYTRNLQPPSGRVYHHPPPVEANGGSRPQVYAPEDVVDISELDPALEVQGEAVRVNLRSTRQKAAGMAMTPVRGTIIDTWA